LLTKIGGCVREQKWANSPQKRSKLAISAEAQIVGRRAAQTFPANPFKFQANPLVTKKFKVNLSSHGFGDVDWLIC
jgi:hypothetical protein